VRAATVTEEDNELSERPSIAAMRCARSGLLAAALVCCSAAAHAQHLSYWAGFGLGSFVTGGSSEPNWHRIQFLALSLPGDYVQLRGFKGSLERPRDIPANVGDDDFDYFGFGVVVTRKATGLPVDLAAGVARYEEVYHLGYPHQDLAGTEFVHRWGPQLSALRSWQVLRFGQAWAEMDLALAPYQPRQVVLFLDIGIGLRVP
jgi:hypothetical protein